MAHHEEMNDTSTWVKDGNAWKCVMHTETPAEGRATNNANYRPAKAAASAFIAACAA